MLVTAILACGEAPVEVTRECPPPRDGAAIVFGEVRDAEAQAVPGTDVLIRLIREVMESDTPVDTIGECVGVPREGTRTVTNDYGSYRAKVFSRTIAEMCIAVTAEIDGLAGFASGQTVELTTFLGECTPDSTLDSVQVDVTLGG